MVLNRYKYFDYLHMHLGLLRACAMLSVFFYLFYDIQHPLSIYVWLSLLCLIIVHHFILHNKWTVLLHVLLVVMFIGIDRAFLFAFFLPIFEGSIKSKFLMLFPAMILLMYDPSLSLVLLFLLAYLVASLYRQAQSEKDYYQIQSDLDRKERYQMEAFNQSLLNQKEETYQLIELSERNRIAQTLHDEVGHELTGAVLGLQALESMKVKDQLTEAQTEMFDKVEKRVRDSTHQLRDTVHKLKPRTIMDIDRIQALVNAFDFSKLSFDMYGDTEQVPVYYWPLIHTIIKEGFTNIMRHSTADDVQLEIAITSAIIRIKLKNNGVDHKANQTNQDKDALRTGIGIRHLRLRVNHYKGTLSTHTHHDLNMFQLIVVLPLPKEETM